MDWHAAPTAEFGQDPRVPCGVPFSLGTMVPSGICIGAFSHREMYSRTHRSLVW